MKNEKPEYRVADAIRKVTAAMQTELEAGRRSTRVDAHDLLDLMLAVADELDPPLPKPKQRYPPRTRHPTPHVRHVGAFSR